MTTGVRKIPAQLIPSLLIAALLGTSLADETHAQSLGFSNNGNQPIEIEADEGIEWQRANQLYIARGNARARQGGGTVEADTLTAFYREIAGGETEIYRIDADGNVRITSDNELATADKAVYDVINGVLVLTGENIRLDTPQDSIVADESLEYYEDQRLAIARGNAIAVRQDRRVRADVLMAHFENGPGGENASELHQIEAVGNVVITTESDIAQADQGDYDVTAGFATLRGNVRITRGDDQINGEFAEFDLNTGISRLIGNPAAPRASRDSGRVKALIIPANRRPEAATQ